MENEIIPMCRICRSTDVGVRQDGSLFCRQCGETVEPCAACGSYDIGEGMNGDAFCRDCGARGKSLWKKQEASSEKASGVSRALPTEKTSRHVMVLFCSAMILYLLSSLFSFMPFIRLTIGTVSKNISGAEVLKIALDQFFSFSNVGGSTSLKSFGVVFVILCPVFAFLVYFLSGLLVSIIIKKKIANKSTTLLGGGWFPPLFVGITVFVGDIFMMSLTGYSDNPLAHLGEGAILHGIFALAAGCISASAHLANQKNNSATRVSD